MSRPFPPRTSEAPAPADRLRRRRLHPVVELASAREVADLAVSAGYWKIAPKTPAASRSSEGIADERSASRAAPPGLQERNRLGMAVLIDEKRLRLGTLRRLRNGPWLRLLPSPRRAARRSRRPAGQIANHGLVVEQGFQPPLTDFRADRAYRRCTGRVLEDIALDDRRVMVP